MEKEFTNVVRAVAGLPGCRFASVEYTAKGTGERAIHRLLLGVSLENAYKRDLALMRRALPRCQSDIESQACREIISSLEESLAKGIGNNGGYTQAGLWKNIAPGVRQSANGESVQVYGFSRGKTVISPGVYKKVNSSAKTIAKNTLRKRMKIGRFRSFCLDQVRVARVSGNVIELA